MTHLNKITEQLKRIDDKEAKNLLNGLSLEELSEVKKKAIEMAHCRDSCDFLGINYNNPSMPKLRLAAYLMMQD